MLNRLREHLEEAEKALRGIRREIRESREAPERYRVEAKRAHNAERARIAYRLKMLGVSMEVIGKAFELNEGKVERLTLRGEILSARAAGGGDGLPHLPLWMKRVLGKQLKE